MQRSLAEIPAHVREFWDAFAATAGAGAASRFYEAFHFCDTEPSANELAVLVLAGTKRATASLLWTMEAQGQRPPRPGDLSVMTNWDGEPLCIIETASVEIVPFEAVGAGFAAAEGEGDRSLAYWRQVHWAYFSRECSLIGKLPAAGMPVVCERFEVVHRHGPQAGARPASGS